MNRFLQTFALLMISLFALILGVNGALERANHSPAQSSYTFYSSQGAVMIAYRGDLHACPVYIRPGTISSLTIQNRT